MKFWLVIRGLNHKKPNEVSNETKANLRCITLVENYWEQDRSNDPG